MTDVLSRTAGLGRVNGPHLDRDLSCEYHALDQDDACLGVTRRIAATLKLQRVVRLQRKLRPMADAAKT